MIVPRCKKKVNDIFGREDLEMETAKLMTIRQTAKAKIAPEHYLRMLEKQGRLPGVRSGNRFLVHTGLLIEQLDRESLAAANGKGSTEEVG